MENNQVEIKKANRKALPKFIIIMLAFFIVGWVLGFCVSHFGTGDMPGAVKSAAFSFGANVAPWLVLGLAIVLPIVCLALLVPARKLLDKWDGENETVSETAERKLSIALWVSGAAYIAGFFLFAAVCAYGFKAFDTSFAVARQFIGIASFLAVMTEMIVFQQRCVDMAKRLYPEKKASIYDLKFQKKWFDECDEAERQKLGRCAYRAYRVTNTVCAICMLAAVFGALFLDIGFFPALLVAVIWGVSLSVYCKEDMKTK